MDAAKKHTIALILGHLNATLTLQSIKHVHKGNVSLSQLALLSDLQSVEFLTMTDISKKMGQSTASATGMVDRLERLRYVERTHDSVDRRKVLVSITNKGGKLLADYSAEIEDSVEDGSRVMDLVYQLGQAVAA